MVTEPTTQPRLALVTGASRGIGQAIALDLARNGYQVIGTATSAEAAAGISQVLAPWQGLGLVLNQQHSDSREQLLADIKQHYGARSVAVLVNNAAITRDGLLLRMKDEDFEAVLNTNLVGVFAFTRALLRDMTRARYGRIVCLGSVVGSTGNPGQGNYAASKAAVVALAKSLAAEVAGRGISVNVVSPGLIETDMTEQLSADYRASILKKIPAERFGTVADVAYAVRFLASEQAGYITGQVLHVNGGLFTGGV